MTLFGTWKSSQNEFSWFWNFSKDFLLLCTLTSWPVQKSSSHVTWWNLKWICQPLLLEDAPACCHLSRSTYPVSEVTFGYCPPNAVQLHDPAAESTLNCKSLVLKKNCKNVIVKQLSHNNVNRADFFFRSDLTDSTNDSALWYRSSFQTVSFLMTIVMHYACSHFDWPYQSILGLLKPCLKLRPQAAREQKNAGKRGEGFKQYSCSHYSSVPCAVQLYSYARLYLGLLSVSLQLFDFWTILFPCCSMLTAKKKHSFGQTTASGDLVARLRRSKVADASRTVPYIYFFTVRRCHGFMVHESVYNESTAVLVSDSGTPALLKG
jgi:hypothetical protein